MSETRTDKPKCKCGSTLCFRNWSNRHPAKSEALAECPACGEKWQIRYWNGRPTSEPYQVKSKAEKTERGSWRMSAKRRAAIVAIYGSIQSFLDNAPLVCMSLQVKS